MERACREGQGTLRNTILQGKVEGARGRGRARRMHMDNVTEWMAIDKITAMRRGEDISWWRKKTIKRVRQPLLLRL